uniref:Luciferase-like domain-containing protein n=1 Tax=Tanacetum cinerariifolium TaxID=118510 RepID=A0A699GEE6_TANCI|nr:hypothetical protein [Tanacetum cinerariifolium]
MPSGPPISTAAVRPMPSMVSVWPTAVHISGSIARMALREAPIDDSSSDMGCLQQVLAGAGAGQCVGGAEGGQLAAQRRPARRGAAGGVAQTELLGNRAVFDHGHPVADFRQHRQLVADEHDGHAQAAVDVAQGGQQGARGFGIERGRGFVAQQHGGTAGQRAGNCHALFLAARQPGGIAVRLAAQLHQFQAQVHAGGYLVRRLAAVDAQREGDVIEHGGVLQQVELLEDHADIAARVAQIALGQRRELLAGDGDGAAVGALQQIEKAQQRGLAGAALADQAKDVAPVDVERECSWKSGIGGGFGQRAVERMASEVADFIIDRVVQRVHAHVAPEAVVPVAGGRGPGAGQLEHLVADVDAGRVGQYLGFGHGHGQFAALAGVDVGAQAEQPFERARRVVGQHGGGPQLEPQLAEAVLDQRVGSGRRRAGRKPRACFIHGVRARGLERAFAYAQVQVGHDQLRHLRAQRRLRRGCHARRLQHLRGGQRHPVEMHVAAVGLLLAERIPVGLHRHAILARGHHADQRRLRLRVPRRDGEPVGAHRPGRKAFDAIEHEAIAHVLGHGAAVERIEGVAPKQILFHGLGEKTLLLLGRAIQRNAGQLQMVKAEHVRQRAVGARQDAHHLQHRGPVGALAAVRAGDRQREQAGGAYRLALPGGVAARPVAGVGGGGQAARQFGGDGQRIGCCRRRPIGRRGSCCGRHGMSVTELRWRSIAPARARGTRRNPAIYMQKSHDTQNAYRSVKLFVLICPAPGIEHGPPAGARGRRTGQKAGRQTSRPPHRHHACARPAGARAAACRDLRPGHQARTGGGGRRRRHRRPDRQAGAAAGHRRQPVAHAGAGLRAAPRAARARRAPCPHQYLCHLAAAGVERRQRPGRGPGHRLARAGGRGRAGVGAACAHGVEGTAGAIGSRCLRGAGRADPAGPLKGHPMTIQHRRAARRHTLGLLFAAGVLGLAGAAVHAPVLAQAAPAREVRIGYQKYGTLTLLKGRAARRPERGQHRFRHRGRGAPDLRAGCGRQPGLRGQRTAVAGQRGNRGAEEFPTAHAGRPQGQENRPQQGLQRPLPAGQGAGKGRHRLQGHPGGLPAAGRRPRRLRAWQRGRMGDLGSVPGGRRKADRRARAGRWQGPGGQLPVLPGRASVRRKKPGGGAHRARGNRQGGRVGRAKSEGRGDDFIRADRPVRRRGGAGCVALCVWRQTDQRGRAAGAAKSGRCICQPQTDTEADRGQGCTAGRQSGGSAIVVKESNMSLNIFWFIPTHGDSRYLGTTKGARPVDADYLKQCAVAADTLGYDGVLLPTGRSCEDAWVVASSLISVTQKLKFLVAIRPGLTTPGLAVRMAATFDRLSNGRLLINVVTGGDQGELEADGLFADHAKRYEISDEFIRVWRASLAGEGGEAGYDFEGKHIQVKGAKTLYPAVQKPYPPLYFGGSSEPAHALAAEQMDVYLTWGEPPAAVAEKLADIRARAATHGRTPPRRRHHRQGAKGLRQDGFGGPAAHGRAARRPARPAGSVAQPVGRRGTGARRRRHGAGRRPGNGGRAHPRIRGPGHRDLYFFGLSAPGRIVPLRGAGVPAAGQRQGVGRPVAQRSVRRDHGQRHRSQKSGLREKASDGKQRCEKKGQHAGKRAGAVDTAGAADRRLAGRVAGGVAVEPHPARAVGRGQGLLGADRVRRIVAAPAHQPVARGQRFCHRRGPRSAARPADGQLPPRRDAARHHAANGAQHPGAGPHSAGDPVVRHRRNGQAVPAGRRRVLPRVPQYLPRHPLGRPGADRNGAQLWPLGLAAVPRRDPAGGAAVHPRGRAVFAGPGVGAADRGRDHFGAGGHRLHDDECARIPANGRGPGRHPAVRLAGQGGRPGRRPGPRGGFYAARRHRDRTQAAPGRVARPGRLEQVVRRTRGPARHRAAAASRRIRGRGGAQRLRQKHAAARHRRAGDGRRRHDCRRPQRGRSRCRCQHPHHVPGSAPAAVENGDRQRGAGPAARAPRRCRHAADGGPGRARRRLAGGAVGRPAPARGAGARAAARAAAAAARRAAGRPRCADPHRNAAADRKPVAGARFYRGAGHARRAGSAGAGRPRGADRSRAHHAGPESGPAPAPGTGRRRVCSAGAAAAGEYSASGADGACGQDRGGGVSRLL